MNKQKYSSSYNFEDTKINVGETSELCNLFRAFNNKGDASKMNEKLQRHIIDDLLAGLPLASSSIIRPRSRVRKFLSVARGTKEKWLERKCVINESRRFLPLHAVVHHTVTDHVKIHAKHRPSTATTAFLEMKKSNIIFIIIPEQVLDIPARIEVFEVLQ